jgi:hypothetical protein
MSFRAGRIDMVKRPERYRNAIVPHIYVDGAADGIAFDFDVGSEWDQHSIQHGIYPAINVIVDLTKSTQTGQPE